MVNRVRRYPIVAVLVVAALAAGVGVGVASVGGDRPNLPPVTPDRLVAQTLTALATHPTVSGQLLSHVALGIPTLPGQAPRSDSPASRLLEALNGDHRVRYWKSAEGVRVSELLPTAELSFIAARSGGRAEAWAWDSRSFTAVHLGPRPAPTPPVSSPAQMFDPSAAVNGALSAIDATTLVSLGPSTSVAGRDAYVLRVEPRTSETLIGRIEISIDAERHLPLRFAVYARGASKPALSLGYTSISFDPIDPSVYGFSPPAGATVIRPDPGLLVGSRDQGDTGASEDPSEYVRTFGHAWTSVLAYRLPPGALQGSSDGVDLGALLPFSGTLFSVRLVDRPEGPWLLIGAVPQSRLASLELQLP